MSVTGDEMNLRDLSWPQVVLALGVTIVFFSAFIILVKLGVDATNVMMTAVLLLLMVLSALGWKQQDKMELKIDQVKDLSNGRISDLMEQNQRLQDQVTALALQIQPRPRDDQ